MIVWAFVCSKCATPVAKGKDYKRISSRYLSRYQGVLGWIAIANKLKFYLIGMVSLFSVAMGLITKQGVYSLFGL